MRNQVRCAELSIAGYNNLIAGITAVIGIIGGIYFVTKSTNDFICKITSRKQKEARENAFICNVCCAEIDENDEKTHVICNICEKYICRNTKCSEWLPETGKWECNLCQTSKESLAQTSSWVADQISFNEDTLICPPRARSEIYIPINEYNDSLIHFESVSQIGANCNTITAEQKIKIRKYVEEVVTKLLGGNLDTIAVNQLSKSEEYLNLFHKYHSKLSNILIHLENVFTYNNDDLPQAENRHNRTSQESAASRGKCLDFSDITETRLRQLIEKIIAETISLPSLPNSRAKSEVNLDRRSRTSDKVYYQSHRHYFDPTIYQDLLATAVLNKIVDKQLNNKQVVPEGGIGISSYGDGDDVNDNNVVLVRSDKNFNIEKLSTSSGSSVEPQSDCSYTEVEQILNNNDDKSSEFHPNSDRESVMSDYLANHMIPLPDLNAKVTESEEDDYTSVTSSVVGDGTWEKNWLFRKKKTTLSTSVTSSSIGMLVPDPKEDIRAQIGDKTADEVSDLSELGTDSDDSLNSLRSQLEPINDRLVNKHLIGGQNSKMILDELIERSSMISNTSPSDGDHILTDACNEDIIDAATKNEAINDNVYQQQPIACKGTENLSNNPLTDQLSYDSNPYDGSRTGTIEEYFENDNDDKDICAINLNNKSYTNTALTPHTNTISETSSDANTNTTKTYNHKEPETRFPSTSPNQRQHVMLTRKIQNENAAFLSDSRQHFHANVDKKKPNDVKIYKNGIDYSDNIVSNSNNVGGHDDGATEHEDGDDDDDDDDDAVAIFRHFVPGSIAEREYKKWYNAVEMPNNPYAPEALKRRISGSHERFIDLPNISPTKDLNTLELLNEPSVEPDENVKLENDYKRYSRDYYINSSSTTTQASPARVVSAAFDKDNPEPTRISPLSGDNETKIGALYKAIPAQVIEDNARFVKTITPTSPELQSNLTSASDDSDTIKLNVFASTCDEDNVTKDTILAQKKQGISNEFYQEEMSSGAIKKSESSGNAGTPTRGSTPVAFKFLQPKRKLLEPNQVLIAELEEMQASCNQLDKPVIEAEVVKALPSVKALARAFLMTTNTTQPEKMWLRKAKTLSQSGKKRSTSPVSRSVDQLMQTERFKPEDDVTISSDLSSLETDSSSVGAELVTASDVTNITVPSGNDPDNLSVAGNLSPVPVQHGVLKNNIAFFENLKNK